jgi:hypothetical protein
MKKGGIHRIQPMEGEDLRDLKVFCSKNKHCRKRAPREVYGLRSWSACIGRRIVGVVLWHKLRESQSAFLLAEPFVFQIRIQRDTIRAEIVSHFQVL